jgi:hypothetical protein
MDKPVSFPMDLTRRKTLLALLALPAGCANPPLAPLRTEPLASPANAPKVRPPALGQSWTYQKFNWYNSALMATEREEVAAVDPQIIIRRKTEAGVVLPEEHQSQWGQIVRDPVWDFVQNYVDPVPLWPASLAVGTSTSTRTNYRLDDTTYARWITIDTTVKAWEKIYLPKGEFNALRIEKFIRIDHKDLARAWTTRKDILWLVPEIGRWAAREISGDYLTTGRDSSQQHEPEFRWELTAWT